MPIKTILVALTLEDDSEPVVGRALQLAGQHEAQLVGVHVVEVSHLGDPSLPAPIDTAAFAATVKARRTDQLHRLLETAGKPAIGHVEMGQPHDIIENLARSYRADIIVIGPGAPKGLREKVFGSTADRVVRCAPCPVLVVRKEADASYRHVAVGVDVSAHAKRPQGPFLAWPPWPCAISSMLLKFRVVLNRPCMRPALPRPKSSATGI